MGYNSDFTGSQVEYLLNKIKDLIIDSVINEESRNPVENRAIALILNEKAHKAKTLKGYGIEDAYTKEEVEKLLNSELDIDIELLEGYIPLSRDFSDDFNNDFTR